MQSNISFITLWLSLSTPSYGKNESTIHFQPRRLHSTKYLQMNQSIDEIALIVIVIDGYVYFIARIISI